MERGPGGNEPRMVKEKMLAGQSFDAALAEVEAAGGFRCPDWWKELNRKVFTDEVKKASVKDPLK